MTYYAWTIEAKGRQPIEKVTTIEEVHDVLRILDLPGLAPASWVTSEAMISDQGTYKHNEGGDDEWSLSWTRINGQE